MDTTATFRQLQAENEALRQHLSTLAGIALAGDVPLEELLQRIVDSARTLLKARYAALGVFDEARRVRHFFTSGITDEERARIGPPPVGAGLLGLIVTERRIVRCPRIAEHPASVGFPPHHPQMTSFLGGPITRGDVVYGNIYLADRLDGVEFSESDERLLALLSNHAAIAIENTQRFARIRENERTASALFEIGRSLASLDDPNEMVDLIVRETRRLLDSDVAAVCLRVPGEVKLRWFLIHGGVSDRVREGLVPLKTTVAGRVLETGVPFQSNDLSRLGEDLCANPLLADEQLRSVIIVPLGHAAALQGVLLVGWRRTGAIPPDAQNILERLADRAAVALAQAQLHAREQAALHQSQLERASLEAIFDSMTDAVFTTDLDGRVVRVNRRASDWSGRAAADMIGHPAEEVLPLVDEVGAPVSARDQKSPAELYLVRPVGQRIPVELVVAPINDANGRTLGTVQVLHDLRPQREVEQLKANIISLVSHELRTPLSHIKGYASSLLQTDVAWDPETQLDFIASIDRQADRLARLISDLLEISRLDAGGAERMELTPVSPAALVERGVRQAKPNAANHPITTSVPTDLELVLADPNHVERVLSNLIENAAKYSPEEAPIDVEVDAHGDEVVFSVRDRGSGLTAEEKEHLFERFYRSPRVKHRTPGTGLGLAICKEIVEAHGGKIWAESEEGEGSVFRFSLLRAGHGTVDAGAET